MNFFNLIQTVYAETVDCNPTSPDFVQEKCPAQLIGAGYTVETVFGNVVNVIAGAATLVFFVMIIIAGLKLVFAQGDPKKISSASSTITWAFVGVIFVVLAWLIINLIGTFTGRTDLTIFKIGTGR